MYNSIIRLVLSLGIFLSASVGALAAPDCATPSPALKPGDATPVENSKISIEPDPKAKWQPRGGTTHFTITGNAVSPADAKVVVCFGWSPDDMKYPGQVSLAKFPTTNAATYGVVIPRNLPDAPSSVSRTALWIVPVATMRVIAYDGAAATPQVVVDAPIGITSPPLAVLLAVVMVVIAFVVFYFLGKNRGVPGKGILLWMISTRDGVASLSQAQIVLWTFLIAASAVYVMVLSGVMIEISDGTLVLLGISAVALVGARLQETRSNGQSDGKLAVPGPVIGVMQVGGAGPTSVRLAWMPPTTGGPVTHYLVQYMVVGAAAGPWTTVAGAITLPHHTVLGLAPATNYTFQVLAANAGGPGAATSIGPIATAAQPVPPANAPGPIGGLYVDGAPSLYSMKLAWSVPAGAPTSYVVEARRNDTTAPWTIVAEPGTAGCIVDKLSSGVAYDFQVSAVNGSGRGLPSAVLTECTSNEPEWSDLIVTGDGRGEIDVTRAQMLVFTLVVALFVGMNVLTNFTIPDIPTGILALMGISNGVYLTAKYIPN